MTIVQVSWCDSERDVRRNYPSAFDGIPERFSAPMAEYVFLDSIEDAKELRADSRTCFCRAPTLHANVAHLCWNC